MDPTTAFTESLTGAAMVPKCLADEGVRFVLGIPVGQYCQFTMKYKSKVKLNIF